MKKEFLIASSISAGVLAGLQTNDILLKFERQGDELLLVEPNIFYTASNELKDIVEVSYPDLVLAKYKIVAESGGEVLIDIKELLSSQTRRFIGSDPGKSATFTQVTRAKSFPENTGIELTFRDDVRTNGVYFNIGELPDTGYKPRVADQRVGYFLTAKNDFSKGERAESTFDRFINRWHLEKQDPDLELSPPKEPIVFYIEDSVPIKYRRWVREGLEVWNEAFEEIGFIDAIEVRQQTDNNAFASYDPEDSRYNFFRWIASQRAFAIAPSRVDPRSGQILDSDILFDESMVRALIEDYDLLVGPLVALDDMPENLRRWLAKNPEEHPNWPQLQIQYEKLAEASSRAMGKTPHEIFARDLMVGRHSGFSKAHTDHRYCSIGSHLNQEMSFHSIGLLYGSALAGDDDAEDEKEDNGDGARKDQDEWPESFVGPIIREIVAHEMGHALGLRHNFKASSWKTVDQIRNSPEGEPTAGSVMDYLPFMMNADGSRPQSWVTPTIGPYDHWAVSYGYAVPGSTGFPSGEKKTLEKVLARNGEPGLAYATDEDVSSPDPLIARWDLGEDSLDFYRERAELARLIKNDILDKLINEGDNYSKARRIYNILLSERFRGVTYATKFIGGYDINREVKLAEDENRAPITVIDADEQREALEFITEELFQADSIELDPETMRYLSARRWYHQGSMDFFNELTFPIQDRILAYQNNVLFRILNPSTIQYLYDAEFYVDKGTDILTIPEVFETLREAVWSEVIDPSGGNSNRDPMIPAMRRNLQRSHLARLIRVSNSDSSSLYPSVARTLSFRELKVIGEIIDEAIDSVGEDRLDDYSLAHLQESRARIEAAINAQLSFGGNNSGGGFFLIMGQEDDADSAVAPVRDYLDY